MCSWLACAKGVSYNLIMCRCVSLHAARKLRGSWIDSFGVPKAGACIRDTAGRFTAWLIIIFFSCRVYLIPTMELLYLHANFQYLSNELFDLSLVRILPSCTCLSLGGGRIKPAARAMPITSHACPLLSNELQNYLQCFHNFISDQNRVEYQQVNYRGS